MYFAQCIKKSYKKYQLSLGQERHLQMSIRLKLEHSTLDHSHNRYRVATEPCGNDPYIHPSVDDMELVSRALHPEIWKERNNQWENAHNTN